MAESGQKKEDVYPPHARVRPQLTQREQDIIKEEKRIGLFRHSLPLAAVFGSLYYMRLKKKNLLGQSVGNDIFRIGLVAGLGYGIGRFFTFERAVKRIRTEVPDGTAAQIYRGEFSGKPNSSWENIQQQQESTERPARRERPRIAKDKPAEPTPEESSAAPLPPFEQRSAPQELDDRFRPNVDSLESKPLIPKVEGDVSSPPSKLRVRRNRYGDEIE